MAKKFLAILLSFAMVLSFTAPAYAEDDVDSTDYYAINSVEDGEVGGIEAGTGDAEGETGNDGERVSGSISGGSAGGETSGSETGRSAAAPSGDADSSGYYQSGAVTDGTVSGSTADSSNYYQSGAVTDGIVTCATCQKTPCECKQPTYYEQLMGAHTVTEMAELLTAPENQEALNALTTEELTSIAFGALMACQVDENNRETEEMVRYQLRQILLQKAGIMPMMAVAPRSSSYTKVINLNEAYAAALPKVATAVASGNGTYVDTALYGGVYVLGGSGAIGIRANSSYENYCYQLTDDLVLTGGALRVGAVPGDTGTLTIDLNGYVLSVEAGEYGRTNASFGPDTASHLQSVLDLRYSVLNIIDSPNDSAPTHYGTLEAVGRWVDLRYDANASEDIVSLPDAPELYEWTDGAGGGTSAGETIWVYNKSANTGTSFTGGIITGGFAQYGGGIRVDNGATLNLEGGTIAGNRTVGYMTGDSNVMQVGQGGGIYVRGSSTVNMNGGKICYNWSDMYGGAVEVFNNSTFNMNVAGDAIYYNKAQGSGGAVSVRGGARFYLENGTIRHNNVYDTRVLGAGGGIYANSGVLDIDGGAVRNNTARTDGGGIACVKSQVDISECGIHANAVTYDTATGGGISLRDCDAATLTGCTIGKSGSFAGNTAIVGGGGLAAYRVGELTLTNCTISDNAVAQDGGGLHVQYGTVTLNNCTITGNETNNGEEKSGSGGGMYIRGADVTMTGGSLSNNTSLASGGGAYISAKNLPEHGDAGAVGCNVTFKDVTISRNKARYYGGAVYGGILNSRDNDTTVAITGSTELNENSAGDGIHSMGLGGAVYIRGINLVVDDQNVTFYENSAGRGGAIYVTPTTDRIAGAEDDSGGMTEDKRPYTVTTIPDGATEQPGGYYDMKLTAENITYDDLNTTKDATANIIAGTFAGNKAVSGGDGGQGGAIAVYSSMTETVVTIGGSRTDTDPTYRIGPTFTGNTAATDGGAVYVNTAPRILVNWTAFEGNLAGEEGGAICAFNVGAGTAEGANAGVSMFESDFSYNTSALGGGAVYVGRNDITENDSLRGYVSANGCTMVGNQATNGAGGAINCYLINSVNIQGNDAYAGNTALTNGGALYFSVCNQITVGNGVTLGGADAGNSARYGGALSCDRVKRVNMYSKEISHNRASINGGGIYITGGTNTLNLLTSAASAAALSYNSADGSGGGAYITDTATISFGDCNKVTTIAGNTAGTNGGGAYIAGVTSGITTVHLGNADSTTSFSANSADFGGGLYITGATATANLTNVTLADNTSASGGGGLYLTGGTATLSDCYAAANKTTGGAGGAVHCVSAAALTVSDGTFVGNSAYTNGGAIYATGTGTGSLTVTSGAVFGGEGDGNTARNGGAIYCYNLDTITLTDAAIAYNEATTDTTVPNPPATYGGGVYVNGGTLSMDRCTVSNNSAITGGGALYLNGSVVMLEDTVLNENRATNGSGGAMQLAGATTVTIADGSALTDNTAAGNGGGIYAAGSSTAVRMTGGSMTGNTATGKTMGHNAYVYKGALTLGAAVADTIETDTKSNLEAVAVVEGTLNVETGDIKVSYYRNADVDGYEKYEGVVRESTNITLPASFWTPAEPAAYQFIGWVGVPAKVVRSTDDYKLALDAITVADPAAGPLSDGTADSHMQIYALWVSTTGQVDCVDGVTLECTTLPYDRTSIEVLTPSVTSQYPGLKIVGWYIYQNEGQNANWGTEYEPEYLPGTAEAEKSYETLDYAALAYRDGAELELALTATTFGTITLIPKYEAVYGDLEITNTVDGEGNEYDPGQTFVFHVDGAPSALAAGEGYINRTTGEVKVNSPLVLDILTDMEKLSLDVVIQRNGTLTVEHLPVGEYTVTADDGDGGWAWRYTAAVGSIEAQVTEVTPGAVAFTSRRTDPYWMDGCDYAMLWEATTVEKKPDGEDEESV